MSPTEAPAEAVLVVDFGTTTTQAALVEGDSIRILHEPATGAVFWPSSVLADGAGGLLVGSPAERGKRLRPSRYRSEIKRDLGSTVPLLVDGTPYPATELVSAVLRAVAAEAHRMLGRPPRHVLLTVPAAYGPADPRRDAMIRAAADAGLDRAELLVEPVAAAYAHPVGARFAAGDVILVHDFGGGTFDAAVVRIGAAQHEVLGHASLEDCGGRDVDAALLQYLTEHHSVHSEAPGDADNVKALRGGIATADFVRDLKHGLSTTLQVEDLSPSGDVVLLERAVLDTLAGKLLDRTVECCRDLLAKADVRSEGLTAVLMVGGSSRSPVVREHLEPLLGVPVRHPEDPQLAVVKGAATWASQAPSRDLRPRLRLPGTEPLAWTVPGGSAVFLGPVVPEGESYEAGDVLAEARSTEGTLHRLRAAHAGEVRSWHREAGGRFLSGDWLVTAVEPTPDVIVPLWRATMSDVRAIGWTRAGTLRMAKQKSVEEWAEGQQVRRLAELRLADGTTRFDPGGEAVVLTDLDARTAAVQTPGGHERLVGLVPHNHPRSTRVLEALPVSPDRLAVTIMTNPDSSKRKVTLWVVDVLGGGSRHVLDLPFDNDRDKESEPHPRRLGLCSGSRGVVWAAKQGAVALISCGVGPGRVLKEIPSPPTGGRRIAAVHPDGRVAAVQPRGRFWSRFTAIAGMSSSETVSVGKSELTTPTTAALEFSPDGRVLAIALQTGWCRIVDSKTCVPLAELAHSPAPITHLAWSHDGTRLALAGGGKVSVWSGELFRP
ncbi:Hsp70 family protein [Streptomyces sp. NPDC057099]|uniref:Hsp70 family protein n=1 Tax=Streptomyces sp. NPDC057099 TaxID=3346019 RepID=UPI0036322782